MSGVFKVLMSSFRINTSWIPIFVIVGIHRSKLKCCFHILSWWPWPHIEIHWIHVSQSIQIQRYMYDFASPPDLRPSRTPVRHEHSFQDFSLLTSARDSCQDVPFWCLTLTHNFRVSRKPLKDMVGSQQSQLVQLRNGKAKKDSIGQLPRLCFPVSAFYGTGGHRMETIFIEGARWVWPPLVLCLAGSTMHKLLQ